MPDLTPLIAELRKLHEKATPGPWLNAGYDRKSGQTVVAGKHKFAVCQVYGVGPAFTKSEGGSMSDDAALIAAMRSALPDLLDRIAALEQQVQELEACLRDAPEPRWVSAKLNVWRARVRELLESRQEPHDA